MQPNIIKNSINANSTEITIKVDNNDIDELLLCEKKDKIIAEYALRRVDSPMGIVEYELNKSLPDKLTHILPTTEEIETELSAYTQDANLSEDEDAS